MLSTVSRRSHASLCVLAVVFSLLLPSRDAGGVRAFVPTPFTAKIAAAFGVKCQASSLSLGRTNSDDDDARIADNRLDDVTSVDGAGGDGGDDDETERDTIRVRIWRALASGDELSMTELSRRVGVRRGGDLKSHLRHVERQARTLRNKKDEWRARRGLAPRDDDGGGLGRGPRKLQLKTRRGGKNETFVRLV